MSSGSSSKTTFRTADPHAAVSTSPLLVAAMAAAAPGAAKPVEALCMATADPRCNFQPARFQRRAVGPSDVLIDMKFCGICHTDVHSAQGHLAALSGRCFPCVPGHELAGVVAAVGADVTRVRVGDHVGVGCMVDSCLTCAACKRGEEQMCSKQVATYNGKDRSGRAAPGPGAPAHTLGGYTDKFVVHERFAVIVPKSYPLECAGPVMCAGVTLFDPLRRYGATKGTRVGIVGIGGLGQMGIRIAKAMGCEVTAITRAPAKAAFAKTCGADEVLVSTNAEDMARARRARSLDLVLNTIPSEHDYAPFTALLAPGGKQVMLGLNTGLVAGMAVNAIVCGRSRVVGSGIGGIEATQAVIDLCAAHDIKPFIKVIPVEGINRVYEELDRANESGARFVIDIGTLNDDAVKRCANSAPPAFGPPSPPLSLTSIVGGICGLLCSCRWC